MEDVGIDNGPANFNLTNENIFSVPSGYKTFDQVLNSQHSINWIDKDMPGEDNFISEGQKVSKGDTICIIEAMKIFNEIEAEKTGTVKLIYVENESPVEFGQPIVEIIPD